MKSLFWLNYKLNTKNNRNTEGYCGYFLYSTSQKLSTIIMPSFT